VRLKAKIERLGGRSGVERDLHERPAVAVAARREESIHDSDDPLQASPIRSVAWSTARATCAQLGQQTIRPPTRASPIYSDTDRQNLSQLDELIEDHQGQNIALTLPCLPSASQVLPLPPASKS
jgi:hypothetical protein